MSEDTTERFVRDLTRFTPRVYAYIRTLVPDRGEAEEILQETNVTLWRKLAEYETVANFPAWACGIARIEVLRLRSRRGKGRLVFGDAFLEAVDAASDRAAEVFDARRDQLARCVDRLADRDRDLVRRRYEDGTSVAGIASAVGRSTDAVYKALNRIHQSLFECVERAAAGGKR